eukprot:TRINITY_DN23583_c0_g1_i1.p1 TRINITY_DN23583_c0_g1~~TRINITY_DN23583_c0_g1_i1.p1  ORF type:complete len:129 (-),score=36.53 TRINITY_DN23583_c0_g1_i1:62-448(-)
MTDSIPVDAHFTFDAQSNSRSSSNQVMASMNVGGIIQTFNGDPAIVEKLMRLEAEKELSKAEKELEKAKTFSNSVFYIGAIAGFVGGLFGFAAVVKALRPINLMSHVAEQKKFFFPLAWAIKKDKKEF